MLHENAKYVVLACCMSHNYMRSERLQEYCPPGYADRQGPTVNGEWRAIVPTVPSRRTNTSRTLDGAAVQQKFTTYFYCEQGSLEWQQGHKNRLS